MIPWRLFLEVKSGVLPGLRAGGGATERIKAHRRVCIWEVKEAGERRSLEEADIGVWWRQLGDCEMKTSNSGAEKNQKTAGFLEDCEEGS